MRALGCSSVDVSQGFVSPEQAGVLMWAGPELVYNSSQQLELLDDPWRKP